MAIVLEGTASLYENAASASVVVPVPSGAVTGEVLVAAITITKDTTAGRTITAPAGWTAFATEQTTPTSGSAGEVTGLYYRLSTSSEPADYTWTTNATADRVTGSIARFSGVDTTTPSDATAVTVTYNNTSGTTVVIPAITTVTNGAMLISVAALHSSTVAFTAVPSGHTLINTSTGTGRRQSWAYFTQATAGSSGTVTWTKTSGSERRLGIMGALRPAPAGVSAAFTGTGTLSAAVLPTSTVAAGFTGTGTLSAAVSSVGSAVSAGFTGTGTLSAAVAATAAISATFTGTGTLSATASSVGGSATLTYNLAGYVTDTAFAATCKTSGAVSVRLKVGTNSAVSTGVLYGSSGTVDGSNWAKSTATGLTADTQYWYQFEMTDGSAALSYSTARGPFTTMVTPGTPESFSLAFGSCLESGSTNSVFNRISARSPDMFFHLGDFHYGDNTSTTQSSHLADLEGQLSANSSLRTILGNVPTWAIKSDHDAGGGNNAMPGTYTAPNRSAYKQVFAHPTLSDTNALYWSFTRGRVKFIFTDHRYVRTSTNMMGTTQEAWFKTEMQTSEPVKIWVQDGVWTSVETPVAGEDKWSDYPTQHAALGAWIAANAVGRVVTIHGDQHAVSADDGSNDTYAGIRAMCAAPFDKASSQKGGPWSEGRYPVSGSTIVRQYGILAITDTGPGGSISLAFNGYDSSDTARTPLTTTVQTPIAAAFSGTGTLSATLAARGVIAASFTGTGTLSAATAGPSVPVAAPLTGTGTLSAAVLPTGSIAASFSGTGTLSAPAAPVAAITASFLGTGTLLVSAAATSSIASTHLGTGTLSATAVPQATISAAFTGAGTLSAVVKPTGSIAAGYTGTGTLSASAATTSLVAASYSGTGTLSASVAPRSVIAASFIGTGTLSASASATGSVAAGFSGSGSLSAFVLEPGQVAASFSGTGTMSATVFIGSTSTTVPFTGTGTLSATVQPTASISASFTGTGTLSAAVTPTRALSVTYSGTGTLTSSVGVAGALLPTYTGIGVLSAVARPRLAITAYFTGSGALSAQVGVPASEAITANFTGTGVMSVNIGGQLAPRRIAIGVPTTRSSRFTIGRPH